MPKLEDQDSSNLSGGMDAVTANLINEMSRKLAELEKKANEPKDKKEILTEDLVKLLAKAVNKPVDDRPVSFFEGYSEMGDTDPEDILPKEEHKTFIAHKLYYVITDGIINNKPVKVPYRPIEFSFQGSKQFKNGKDTDLFVFSTYTCKSKKELEFLRAHHLFGVTFFDHINTVTTHDSLIAQKIAVSMASLKSMGAFELVSMCKQYGIEPSTDPSVMRAMLATKIANDQYEKEREKSETIARENELQKEIIGRE